MLEEANGKCMHFSHEFGAVFEADLSFTTQLHVGQMMLYLSNRDETR